MGVSSSEEFEISLFWACCGPSPYLFSSIEKHYHCGSMDYRLFSHCFLLLLAPGSQRTLNCFDTNKASGWFFNLLLYHNPKGGFYVLVVSKDFQMPNTSTSNNWVVGNYHIRIAGSLEKKKKKSRHGYQCRSKTDHWMKDIYAGWLHNQSACLVNKSSVFQCTTGDSLSVLPLVLYEGLIQWSYS